VYLANRFRLQVLAGKYADAAATLAAFDNTLPAGAAPEARAANLLYAIHARAMAREAASANEALRDEFRATMLRTDDRTAALVARILMTRNLEASDATVNQALRAQSGRAAIAIADAVTLLRAHYQRDVFRALVPALRPLVAEDDRRRYVIASDVRVAMSDGGTVCALVVRPRKRGPRFTTILNFTIYADSVTKLTEARRTASNGYVAVVGYTRGKLCSPDVPVPYERDGSDASELIDWISRQSWSDGRVGMYGGSYEGFATWAATKRMPSALKAIAPLVAVAPGLDVPMEGNVFVNFVYPWPFFALNTKDLDSTTYNDFRRWNRLNREWYVSGRAYRDMEKIDGTPNPIFDRWISHPTYDAYWQSMIPYASDFSRIKIPVLQTAGYFFGGPGAVVYYFTEHYKHDPNANHTLVIGPYDHPGGQRGPVNALGDTAYDFAGYRLDPVALVDLQHLRYAWFDHVFKGAPKPALLADKINYQVMGANVWKHAPSIAAMSNEKFRFYFDVGPGGALRRLTSTVSNDSTPGTISVDLAYRGDIERVPAGGGIEANAIDTVDVLTFVSDPLPKRTEVSGLFSGQLDYVTNVKDFDLYVAVYELTASGRYVLLSTMNQRASHAKSVERRELLTPGVRQRLTFSSSRLMSRELQAGSRLVVQWGPIKAPSLQINYGSGKDVSDETVADAREPLTIKWLSGSFIDIPTAQPAPPPMRPH
jgi:putative CocE/NonD family hydrolase